MFSKGKNTTTKLNLLGESGRIFGFSSSSFWWSFRGTNFSCKMKITKKAQNKQRYRQQTQHTAHTRIQSNTGDKDKQLRERVIPPNDIVVRVNVKRVACV